MKKNAILFLLILSIFSSNSISQSNAIELENYPDYCSEPVVEDSQNDYSLCEGSDETSEEVPSYIDTRDYKEIYKLDGVWYGIIDIESRNLFTTENGTGSGITNPVQSYFLEFSLTRETKYLKSIKLQYEVEAYCPILFNACFLGGTIAAFDSGVIEFVYDDSAVGLEDAKNIDEVFGDGNITKSIDPDFDYVIDLDHSTNNEEAVATNLVIFEFVYVLTNEAVDEVEADIQAQYDQEVEAILHDDSMNITTKQLALEQLNLEYQEYTIEYDEEIRSLCLNDELCEVEDFESDDILETVPTWVDNLLDKILTGTMYILGILTGSAFIGYIIYSLAKKGVEQTGLALWNIIKGAFRTGAYFGKYVAYGLLKLFGVVGRGAIRVKDLIVK